ncbi:zinc finger BED domain-containing protein RICESLEEPER 2-like protein [Tanacetum coccineum]
MEGTQGKPVDFKHHVKDFDKTVKHPKGIAENIPVGIGKFVLPVDFIILDMPEDVNVPLILGRPFLSTAHDKVDVFKRKITLRIDFRRNQVDLEPTIEEGKVVNEPMMDIVKTRCDFIGGLDDYPIVEDMDPYLDEGTGDVIVGEPFCKASCVEARRFDGIIYHCDGDD